MGADPDAVFSRMRDFGNYPQLANAVRRIDVVADDDGFTISDWEVTFRRGIMKWRERDVINDASRTIAFRQLEGDLAHFAGNWSVVDGAGEVTVRFSAEFDLGIPSLASMLDPVAEQTLRENVTELIDAFVEVGR